jgi:hypothetical protein
MITVTSNIDGPPLTFNVTLRGLAIYLDTFALIHLAERDRVLGKRFIALFGSQVDLLFSVTNAAELAGSQGASFEAVKKFLNEIGPHWFPVELDAFEVVKRERNAPRRGLPFTTISQRLFRQAGRELLTEYWKLDRHCGFNPSWPDPRLGCPSARIDSWKLGRNGRRSNEHGHTRTNQIRRRPAAFRPDNWRILSVQPCYACDFHIIQFDKKSSR